MILPQDECWLMDTLFFFRFRSLDWDSVFYFGLSFMSFHTFRRMVLIFSKGFSWVEYPRVSVFYFCRWSNGRLLYSQSYSILDIKIICKYLILLQLVWNQLFLVFLRSSLLILFSSSHVGDFSHFSCWLAFLQDYLLWWYFILLMSVFDCVNEHIIINFVESAMGTNGCIMWQVSGFLLEGS